MYAVEKGARPKMWNVVREKANKQEFGVKDIIHTSLTFTTATIIAQELNTAIEQATRQVKRDLSEYLNLGA